MAAPSEVGSTRVGEVVRVAPSRLGRVVLESLRNRESGLNKDEGGLRGCG